MNGIYIPRRLIHKHARIMMHLSCTGTRAHYTPTRNYTESFSAHTHTYNKELYWFTHRNVRTQYTTHRELTSQTNTSANTHKQGQIKLTHSPRAPRHTTTLAHTSSLSTNTHTNKLANKTIRILRSTRHLFIPSDARTTQKQFCLRLMKGANHSWHLRFPALGTGFDLGYW